MIAGRSTLELLCEMFYPEASARPDSECLRIGRALGADEDLIEAAIGRTRPQRDAVRAVLDDWPRLEEGAA